MSKKVIKLTESQIKTVINKIIKEQETTMGGVPNKPASPSAKPVAKINNQEAFINYGGGSSKQRFEILKKSGLDLTSDYNEFLQLTNAQDPKLAKTIFNYVANSFVPDFLKYVARMSYFKEDIISLGQNNTALTTIDKLFGTNYTKNIPMIFGADGGRGDMRALYNALSNLVTSQRQATSNPTKKGV